MWYSGKREAIYGCLGSAAVPNIPSFDLNPQSIPQAVTKHKHHCRIYYGLQLKFIFGLTPPQNESADSDLYGYSLKRAF